MDLSARAWAAKPYPEIQEIAERDGSVLIVPIGSLEQHGHHLPVATDSLLVEAVARLGADRVTDEVPVLTMPVFWAGFSPHHRSFGGTVSLPFDVLREALEGVATAGIQNGFDAVLLLNGHGGNQPLVAAAVSTIGDANPETEVLGLTYFELAAEFIGDIRDSEPGGMAHAGEFETALMLELYPNLVREDAIAATPQDEPYKQAPQEMFVGGPLSVYREFEEYAATGAIGAPELATAEKGAEIRSRIGDVMEALLREIHEQNRA